MSEKVELTEEQKILLAFYGALKHHINEMTNLIDLIQQSEGQGVLLPPGAHVTEPVARTEHHRKNTEFILNALVDKYELKLETT